MEYRIDKEAFEKMPATNSPEEVNRILGQEQYFMEVLLVCEVRRWDRLFWNKFKAFLIKIGNERVEEKERLTREWRANCWERLNTQMDAALKRMANVDDSEDKDSFLKFLDKQWAKSASQLFEGVKIPDVISLSKLRRLIGDKDEEMRLRMENEIEDVEFRLKRGSDLGRFDQFWDGYNLFECRYSRSKWLNFMQSSTVPLEVYSHYLKGNKNITHITFRHMFSDFDVNRFLCDLPWVTSISPDTSATIPAIRRDLLFIESTNNDLNTFATEIKSDSNSTYIFSDAGFFYSDELRGDARVLISFVAPKSGKKLLLRVKHSGEGAPLDVTLGSNNIQLNPSSKSSLTIDYITLQVPGPSGSGRLSFVPEVRNDIFIQFVLASESYDSHLHGHILHDIELLDDVGLDYLPHSASFSNSV